MPIEESYALGSIFGGYADYLVNIKEDPMYTYHQYLPGARQALRHFGAAGPIKAMAMTGRTGPLRQLSQTIANYDRHDFAATSWYRPVGGQGIASASDLFTQDMQNKFLICERCGECYNEFFARIIPKPSRTQILNDSISMSYVYCARNANNVCELSCTQKWHLMDISIRLAEEAAADQCSTLFSQLAPQVTTREILGLVAVNSEFQIETLYQSLRVAWHWIVFSSQKYGNHTENDSMPEQVRRGLINIAPIVAKGLVMWGDARTDLKIHDMGLIAARAIEYTYQVTPSCLRYMIEENDWDMEIKWINEYVGLRRYMTNVQFALAKRAIQRAAASMQKTVALARNPFNAAAHNSAIAVAKFRFRELHSSMRADMPLHAVDRRTTETVPPKGFPAPSSQPLAPTPTTNLVPFNPVVGSNRPRSLDSTTFHAL